VEQQLRELRAAAAKAPLTSAEYAQVCIHLLECVHGAKHPLFGAIATATNPRVTELLVAAVEVSFNNHRACGEFSLQLSECT
jgi:hypothetical protein